jgi:hypothetical protein
MTVRGSDLRIESIGGEVVVSWFCKSFDPPHLLQLRHANEAEARKIYSPPYTIHRGKFRFFYRKFVHEASDPENEREAWVDTERFLDHGWVLRHKSVRIHFNSRR